MQVGAPTSRPPNGAGCGHQHELSLPPLGLKPGGFVTAKLRNPQT